MKRWNAINKVLIAAKECEEVIAIFLKGSIAEGIDDEFSDVDFYCLVQEDRIERFLPKRLSLLTNYRPLVYWSEADFVGPQIVAVFDDGLHFDLYTVTETGFPLVGHFTILYDPGNVLAKYESSIQALTLSSKEIVRYFEEFSFTLLEFEAAWCRGDICWSVRLASHLSANLSFVLRYLHEPKKARLGLKRLEGVLPTEVKHELRHAISACVGGHVPDGVLKMCSMMEAAIAKADGVKTHELNWTMWNLMKGKILRLVNRCC